MGQMVSPSKFLFNVDFTAPPEPEDVRPAEPEIPMIPVSEHNRLVQEAKKQAFEEGRLHALQEHQSHQDRLLTEEVGHLVGAVGRVLEQLDEEQTAVEKDAAGLAFLVARRLCAHLIARQPLAEVVALISNALGPLRRAPHLVIRIHEKDVEALKTRIDPIVTEKGYDGRLVILGEPDIGRGDCRIEWADGGIIRDRKALEKDIDGRIRAYLKARADDRKQDQATADPATQRDG